MPTLYCGDCDHEWTEQLDAEGRRTWGDEADQRRKAKREQRARQLRTLTVTCTDTRPSDCMPDDEGAVDATLTIVVDGEERVCGVTLLPGQHGLSTWGGERSHWADDSTQASLDAWAGGVDADGDARDERELREEIEGAVQDAVRDAA